jgi:SAM-dependent methyltransferase
MCRRLSWAAARNQHISDLLLPRQLSDRIWVCMLVLLTVHGILLNFFYWDAAMDRRVAIMQGLEKAYKGVEVAPWFSPLAPKREGYDCLVLDVFDTPTLLARAKADPNIPADSVPNIASVDFVGNAIDIAELVEASHTLGSFDYVVSSHNFEHLPDPIRFLQGCQKILKVGGIVSMAIPDKRACFDYFRQHTMLDAWLEAYLQRHRKPTPRQIFSHYAYGARKTTGSLQIGTTLDSPMEIETNGDLIARYQSFVAQTADTSDEYHDAHCWCLTPRSLELLLIECRQLGLLHFKIIDISGPAGCEFFIRLQSCTAEDCAPLDSSTFQALRTGLLHQIDKENAETYNARVAPPKSTKPIARLAEKIRRDPKGAGKAIIRRALRFVAA